MSQSSSIIPSGKSLLNTFERVLGDNQIPSDSKTQLKKNRQSEEVTLKKPNEAFEFYGRNGSLRNTGALAAGSRFDQTI